MGGRSPSSSSSTTQTTTENYDQRVTVGEEGFGVGAGATVTLTDLGVVGAAENLLRDAFEGAANIIEDVTDFAGGVVKANTAILEENVESDTKELASLIVKVGAALAGIVALGAFYFRGKK